jgi:hypothetical protein
LVIAKVQDLSFATYLDIAARVGIKGKRYDEDQAITVLAGNRDFSCAQVGSL